MSTLPLIYDLTLPELEAALKDLGQPAYRARQIWQGLYHQLWDDPAQFTALPATLREQLRTAFRFQVLTAQQTLHSSDGETVKTLFKLPDDRMIEAVLMRYNERKTLCISSQAGCAMGCVFCATGQMGFLRHLSSGEIVAQVLHYARMLRSEGFEVTNVRLEFKDGKVINASADKNQDFLLSKLDTDVGARYLGEFAIGTNEKINRFTGQILFDEKIGGSFHLAIGHGYPESQSQNESAIHWDMICDLRKGGSITVDGELFYKDGKFSIDF